MFDYVKAIEDTVKKEQKAVNEFRDGSLKAWNYLFGKVDQTQWDTSVLPNGKPLTIGHKLDPKDIAKIIIQFTCIRGEG